jgi:hypothetical protein
MTAYTFPHSIKSSFPTSDVQERKTARRKIIEDVEARRKIIGQRWYKKMQKFPLIQVCNL